MTTAAIPPPAASTADGTALGVPVAVARTDPAPAADAFLLPDAAADRLGWGVAAVSADGAAAVFRVAGGCLLVPPGPTAVAPPGLLRLRRAAPHLYLPVDGRLVPALLPDEFAGLTRGGGLVLTPGGGLAFDPAAPVPAGDWLAVPPPRAVEWSAFPPPPPGATALRLIERPAPPAAVAELLAAGGPADPDPLSDRQGERLPDDARPPAGSFLGRVGAGAAFGLAAAAAWAARAVGAGGLARAAAGLVRKAVERVPRLSERVVGAQEAALRELLRQLRDGDAERALRRAPVATPDPDGRGRLAGGSDLGEHATRFSLAELLRGGGGPASVWVGGGDVWEQLRAEYRRMAEAAVGRGDYRRAAYLWGVLLRDLRAAANVLRAGGCHREAGVLYRDRLGDPPTAAAAFEAAGEYDEAVRLYERAGDHLRAGDLLRRLGDDRATTFYQAAADALAARGERLQAGDLLRGRLGRDDLADGHYAAGWASDGPNAVACGQRLLDSAVMRADAAGWEAVLAAAAGRLAPPRTADAGRLFNHALDVGGLFMDADRLDDLRDRVRGVFADHLRHGTGTGRADALFASGWPATVWRDAGYAANAERPARPTPPPAKPVAAGAVRAVAWADGAGVLFVATDTAVTAWDARTETARAVAHVHRGGLLGVCAADDGRLFLTLAEQPGGVRLTAHTRDGTARGGAALASADVPCLDPAAAYLPPRLSVDAWVPFAVVDAGGRRGFLPDTLAPVSPAPFDRACDVTRCVGSGRGLYWDWADDELVAWRRDGRTNGYGLVPVGRCSPGWTPAGRCDVLAPDDATLVLAGVDAGGVVHRTEVSVNGAERWRPVTRSATDPAGFVAAALVGRNRVAAVTRTNRLHTFRAVAGRLHPLGAQTPLWGSRPAVALVWHAAADMLLVVAEDGRVAATPMSR